MPLQNRVTPFAEIVAVPDRGTFMGNRGRIHNARRELGRRRWERKAWITCLLRFKGRHRHVMAPRSYTELFFLDEATALAAGHRPCAECRRADANRFKRLWLEANCVTSPDKSAKLSEIDALLHVDRIDRDGSQRRWEAALSELPDGTMVWTGETGAAYLLDGGHLHKWSSAGYVEKRPAPFDRAVTVLTPASITRTLAAGYHPVVHPSARS